MKRVIPVVLFLAAAGAFWFWWSAGRTQEAANQFSGTVEARQVLVGSKLGGRVAEVLVLEGDDVKPGQLIARFETLELRAQRQALEAGLRQAETTVAKLRRGYRTEEIAQARAGAEQSAAQLEALRNGPRPQEIAQAEAELAGAEADAQNAEAAYARTAALQKTGDVSKQAYDNALSRRDGALARVRSLRERVALLKAGSRAEEIRAAEARQAQTQAQARLLNAGFRPEEIQEAMARRDQVAGDLAALDARLAESEVKAPNVARVETLSVRPGDLVAAGRPVATLLEPSQLWVRVYVPEPRLPQFSVGQRVAVRADSEPDKWYAAHIDQIATQGEFLPRNVQTRDDRNHLVFALKVRIDATGHALKAGMAATMRGTP